MVDQWLAPIPKQGIWRGIALFTALLAARRILSDAQFVLLAQVTAIVLVAGAFVTGRRRARAVALSLDSDKRGNSDDVSDFVTLVGVLGSVTLILSPTILAYNSRPDDVVAAVFFSAALYRLPYQLAQSFAPELAALAVERNWFRSPILWLAPAGLIAALFAAGFAALTGPLMFDFLVGDGELLRRPIYSAIAATTTIASINLICALALIDRVRWATVAAAWLVPGAIVAYPVLGATEPEPLFEALELYVAMVYLGQLWIWSRSRRVADLKETH